MSVRRWAGGVLAAVLSCAVPAPAAAVLTHDLFQDTPRTRELLKAELGASALPAADTASGAPVTIRTEATPGRGEFESIWLARERYLQIGEAERAEQQLSLLVEKALERGVRNLPEYGTVLVREAVRRMKTGDWDEAANALGWAARLAPDELPVHTTAALLAFRRNPLNLSPIIEAGAAAVRAIRRSFRLQVWLRANLLGTLTAGLSFFLAFSLAVAAAAAAPRFVHDVRETVGFGSLRTRTVLSWGIFALPALVGLSPWWWVIVACLVLWPYFPLPARVLSVVGALFLFALPYLVRERAALLTLSERPLLAAVVQVREGSWTPADQATLAAEVSRGRSASPGVTALGLASWRLGRLDEAEATIRAGLKTSPADPSLWNNLGNIAFARQDVAGAVADYAKAVELAPRLFAPHHNLGLAYREGFKFAEGEAETRLAAEIDPEAAAFYAGLDSSGQKALTVDVLPSLAGLWALAHERGDDEEAAVEHLWGSLMLGAPIGAWPAVAGALLVLGAAFGAWRLKRGAAASCERCGKVFCRRCQPGRRGELCSQCHHIFVKKEGVDARVRVQKMGEIKSRRGLLRIRHLVCAAIAPGGGHLSAGRFLPGLVLLAPAAFLEARVLFGQGAYRSPWSLEGAASAWLVGAGVALFAALWGLSFWLTLRIED